MSKTALCAKELSDILRSQISSLSNLYACQKRMFSAVLERDWVSLETSTRESDALATIFSRLEEERNRLLRSYFPEAEGSIDFYHITLSFSDAERTLANSLFREMKQLLLLCRTENDVFAVHVQNARSIVQSLVETCIPNRQGKVYGRNGSLVSSRMDTLVLNRSL